MTIDPTILTRVRQAAPLVHCMCNIVAANDCANVLLACGARPVMAHAPQEAAEIAASAASVVLNTGTPDEEKFRACMLAGVSAQAHGIPVVLDPVGAGASSYRRAKLQTLVEQVRPNLIHGNWREVQALRGMQRQEGVDAPESGALTQRAADAKGLAKQLGCVVLLSGETDLVSDGARTYVIRGGDVRMRYVTGTGCMLSALLGAFAAVAAPMDAAVAASCFWKACAASVPVCGPGSFHAALLDAVWRMEADLVQRSVLCEDFAETAAIIRSDRPQLAGQ